MTVSKSFNIFLEPYCEFCNNFEADVQKIDITTYADKVPKAITNIRCNWCGVCQRIAESEKVYEKSETV